MKITELHTQYKFCECRNLRASKLCKQLNGSEDQKFILPLIRRRVSEKTARVRAVFNITGDVPKVDDNGAD